MFNAEHMQKLWAQLGVGSLPLLSMTSAASGGPNLQALQALQAQLMAAATATSNSSSSSSPAAAATAAAVAPSGLFPSLPPGILPNSTSPTTSNMTNEQVSIDRLFTSV
ncbi:hypothetical protein WR25_25184 [Diploscapter pachys]|jgi:hypothetical protein|uniref:Uncharacterized protein n=1 Tax=Diploscapter pachys TaxID=2018661 RepID=A0A2A2JA65_9BILA|nr:hypothetical protein WR25_25184 [Diploscapter pachys]